MGLSNKHKFTRKEICWSKKLTSFLVIRFPTEDILYEKSYQDIITNIK